MTSATGRRSGGRVATAALVVGVLAVAAALAVLWTQAARDDVGRGAVEVAARRPAGAGAAAVPPDGGATAASPTTPSTSTVAAPPVGRRPAAVAAAPPAPGPVRVSVPALGVDALVDPVGVEPDGSMTVPADPDRVGWYRFGPAPGTGPGSAVLAGHVDTARDGAGAFAALAGVAVGQDVHVTLADGTVVPYRVEGRETFVKRELPLEVLFARDGPARLTLVTCGGPFQPELRSYRDNVVVTAVPVAP